MILLAYVGIAVLIVFGIGVVEHKGERADCGMASVVGLFWPVLAACAVVAAPFVGAYYLGRYLDKRFLKLS